MRNSHQCAGFELRVNVSDSRDPGCLLLLGTGWKRKMLLMLLSVSRGDNGLC